MANLTNGNVVPTETDATATVDSDSTEGTIYCAVRPAAFGAYQTGDEDAIKNGTDATWYSVGGQTPVIGTNTFSPTGLTESTSYHCGFAQETPEATIWWEHSFATTASLGDFTHTRSTTNATFDSNGDFQSLGINAPGFPGAAWSGSAFTPHANCDGLLFSKVSTLTLNPNEVTVGPWTAAGLDASVTDQRGEMLFTTLTTTSANPSNCYVSIANNGYGTGPFYWMVLMEGGDSSETTIELGAGGSMGSATFTWSSGVPSVSSTVGARAYVNQQQGNLWSLILASDTGGASTKTVFLHPFGVSPTIASGASCVVNGGALVDDDASGATVDVPQGSSRTIDRCVISTTLAAIDRGPVSGSFCGQMVYKPLCRIAATNSIFALVNDVDNTNRFYVTMHATSDRLTVAHRYNDDRVRCYVNVPPIGEWINFRYKYDDVAKIMKCWTNSDYDEASTTQNNTVPLTHMFLAHDTFSSPSGQPDMIVSHLRFHDEALDDSIVSGWT